MGFTPTDQSIDPAVKIDLDGFDNLYKVSDELYRSEQPDSKGMVELQKTGIATVLNLRKRRNDNHEGKGTDLVLSHIPINTWKMTYEDVVNSLKVINQAKKPVLVHCLHGSDRTGVVVAAYRMAFQNWKKEDAIHEFREAQFGFHENWFPDLLQLVQDLDVAQLKKNIGLNP